MRFMMIVKATKESESGAMPSEQMLTEMMQYNEALSKAGVLRDLAGLHPSHQGWRVKFSGPKRTVVDGPFTESKELIAGYWLIDVASKEEAIEWAKRCPNPHEGESEIEVRRLFDVSDFAEANAETRAAAAEVGRKLNRPES